MAFALDDAEYEISYLKREIDELRVNLAKMLRRLDSTAPKAKSDLQRPVGQGCATTSSFARSNTRERDYPGS